jgi:hypothetical protein
LAQVVVSIGVEENGVLVLTKASGRLLFKLQY